MIPLFSLTRQSKVRQDSYYYIIAALPGVYMIMLKLYRPKAMLNKYCLAFIRT